MKKLKNLIMALVLILGVSLATCLNTQAAGKEVKPYMSLDSTQLLNSQISFGSSIGGVPNNKYTITSVKSSNTKAIVVDKQNTDTKTFFLKAKAVGKSNIVVKVKVGQKTYTLKKKVEVVDDKPFSNIKYNGKNIYKGHEYTIPTVKVKSGKVFSWKLNKGYKVINSYLISDKGTTKVKSGQKLYFKSNSTSLYFFIQTPDNKYISYTIHFVK